MVVGVTLVNVVAGQERRVFEKLGEIPGIRGLHHVFGEYDFLVIIEVDGLPLLSKTVDVIRDVPGVTTTTPSSALNSQTRNKTVSTHRVPAKRGHECLQI